jgi:PAS domain S-box-containing protein
VLLAVAPGFGLIFYAARSQRALLERDAARSVVRAAQLAAEQQQHTIDTAQGMLGAFAQNPAVLVRDEVGCSRVASALVARQPHFASIGATDAEGRGFCNTTPTAIPFSIADRRYFQAALQRRGFSAGEYQVSRVRHVPSVNFAYPALDDAGVLQAVVFASVDLSFIDRQLAEMHLPEQGWAVITDHAGIVLAGHPASAFRRGTAVQSELLQGMRRSPREVAQLGSGDGVERLFSFRTVTAGGETAMRIAVGIPTASVYGPANRIFKRTLLGYALVGGLALLLSSLASHLLLVRRLGALARAARRLSRGDYAARTGLTPTGEELGDLIRAFDEMAISLESLTRQNRLILDSAGEGIFGIDRQGRITFVNPAASTLLGRQPCDLLGRDAHLLFHHSRQGGDPSRDEVCPILSLPLEGGPLHVAEDSFQRGSGAAFPVEYVATPIRDDGEIVGVVVAFKDVTDRKRLEEELRQAQKMEAVGQLAGGVAHDFNNILTAILSAGRFARDALSPEHPARADIDDILGAAGRAASLTRQLLAFSKRQVIEPRSIDLAEAVRGVEKMLRRLIGEDVQLETVTRAGPCWVRADAGQIDQVILNLAVNARDAMPAGGRIVIEVAPVGPGDPAIRGDSQLAGPLVMVSMSDSGMGMDAATVSRIFEPFFTTKGVGKGTGLGLSTVYGIVQQSRGAVRVTSTPGNGTTFRIYLPRIAPPAIASVRPGARAPRGTETVLLVEDEGVLRGLARRALAGAGYRVLEADGARAALACAEQHRGTLDLLLTDVVMPEVSGVQLARDLVRRIPGLRVLHMSGYAGALLDASGVADSGHSFLQKPFTPEVLLRKVREVLDQDSATAPRSVARSA